MAKIYVSSTYADLAECRDQVRRTLRRMQHEDVAMEYYVAEDARPLDRCLADVESCDLYICIVAHRYGFIPDGYDKSITELEYRRARDSGKTCLAFLLKKNAKWPADQIEFDAYPQVVAFREELRRSALVGEFEDSHDLGTQVATAIHRWEKAQGTVRPASRIDWEAYRRSVFEQHRWVRLQVIAGAKQDRESARIPLTEVFVSQPCRAGRPEYDVPENADTRGLEADSIVEPPDAPGTQPRDDAEASAVEDLAPPRVVETSLDVLARERRQVVLGGPGSGKSTLLLTALLRLCDPDGQAEDLPEHLRRTPVPLLVELRQYALRRSSTLIDYLVQALQPHGVDVDAAALRDLFAGDDAALVLFDGLDEVFGASDRSQIVDEVRGFARLFPNTRVVVTSRNAGYDGADLERDDFSHYTLLDFGMPEVCRFIPQWYIFYTWEGDERALSG